MTAKLDNVATIDMLLQQTGLPSYTQVLDALEYLQLQAKVSNFPAGNGAMRCAARTLQEAAGARNEVY